MSPFKIVVFVYFCLLEYNFAHIVPQISERSSFLENIQKECGFVNPEFELSFRVLRGRNARMGQYPWMVNLFYSEVHMKQNLNGCGGSLISDRHVLTAAHCCVKDDLVTQKAKWVRVGEYNLEDKIYGENIPVDKYIIHENYDPDPNLHDICILHLAKSVEFNDQVRPICLPLNETFQHIDFEGEYMEVAGWGLSLGDRTTPILQTATVSVLPSEVCKEVYQISDTRNSICALGEVNGKIVTSCRGDSGGPLMKSFKLDGRTTYFVFGTVSYGLHEQDSGYTCDSTKVSVYMKVTQYMEWILNNIF